MIIIDEGYDTKSFHPLGRMQAGVILLRPCYNITNHMIDLLNKHIILRYTTLSAEQDFFHWYFRYERLDLPIKYNAIRHKLIDDRLTRAGTKPLIVHTTLKHRQNNITLDYTKPLLCDNIIDVLNLKQYDNFKI